MIIDKENLWVEFACSVHGCSGIHPFYMHAQITDQPVDAASQAKMDVRIIATWQFVDKHYQVPDLYQVESREWYRLLLL